MAHVLLDPRDGSMTHEGYCVLSALLGALYLELSTTAEEDFLQWINAIRSHIRDVLDTWEEG